jgi:hypothetical protein
MSAAEIRRPIRRPLTRSTWKEAAEVAHAHRTEAAGGVLLLVGVVVAMVVTRKYPPTRRIERITTYQLEPHFAHLDLPPHSWAADGLLAVCSFLPASSSSETWSPVTCGAPGRPVLLVMPSRWPYSPWWILISPSGLRAVLPTLAAVDDLIAIVINAVVYMSAPRPLNRTTDESMEGSIMGKRIVVLVISVCRCNWALDSRQRFRTSSHRDRRSPPGHHRRRGRRSPTRRWHPDAEPARSEGRSGGRQRSGPAVAGDRPSLTSAWVPVRRCRS